MSRFSRTPIVILNEPRGTAISSAKPSMSGSAFSPSGDGHGLVRCLPMKRQTQKSDFGTIIYDAEHAVGAATLQAIGHLVILWNAIEAELDATLRPYGTAG